MRKFIKEYDQLIFPTILILAILIVIWGIGFGLGENHQKDIDNNKPTCKEVVNSTTGYFDSKHAYYVQADHGNIRIPEGCVGDPTK